MKVGGPFNLVVWAVIWDGEHQMKQGVFVWCLEAWAGSNLIACVCPTMQAWLNICKMKRLQGKGLQCHIFSQICLAMNFLIENPGPQIPNQSANVYLTNRNGQKTQLHCYHNISAVSSNQFQILFQFHWFIK